MPLGNVYAYANFWVHVRCDRIYGEMLTFQHFLGLGVSAQPNFRPTHIAQFFQIIRIWIATAVVLIQFGG